MKPVLPVTPPSAAALRRVRVHETISHARRAARGGPPRVSAVGSRDARFRLMTVNNEPTSIRLDRGVIGRCPSIATFPPQPAVIAGGHT